MATLSNKIQIRNDIKKQCHHFADIEKNNIISDRFQALILPLLISFKNIAVYYPRNLEIDILPLMKILSRNSFKLLLPVINQQNNLDFYAWKLEDKLIESKYSKNILEPSQQNNSIIPDAIIAPLIACDLHGNRIGSGKGMYDKYIAHLKTLDHKALYIGVCYDFQLLDNITPDNHDQPLELILTDKRFINHLAV